MKVDVRGVERPRAEMGMGKVRREGQETGERGAAEEGREEESKEVKRGEKRR